MRISDAAIIRVIVGLVAACAWVASSGASVNCADMVGGEAAWPCALSLIARRGENASEGDAAECPCVAMSGAIDAAKASAGLVAA